MSILHGYLEYEELQATLGAKTSAKQADYERAIATASRIVDGICSCPKLNIVRHFWRDETPTQRLYCADSPRLVRVGDFASADDMVVEIWVNGTWVPLDDDQWQAEPFNLVNGFPHTTITATDYGPLFPLGLRAMVRCTDRWGWLADPEAAGTATQILSVALLQGIDIVSTEDYTPRADGGPFELAYAALDAYIPDEVKAWRATRKAMA